MLEAQGFKNQLDQYRVIKQLGDGATSKVYLAQHRSTGEQFALKLMKSSTMDEFEFKKRI